MPGDYEEKYLALRDENTALKKKKNEQEATIKRMYTKLAMIEEALKKKRQVDDAKPVANSSSDNQNEADAGRGKADGAVLPVRRDVDAEKFIQVLRSENAALRKKNQSLAEKNRWLQEKLATRPGKPALTSSLGPPKAGNPGAGKRKADGARKSADTIESSGATIESQIQSVRKLNRDTFSRNLEVALKSRLVVAEKQLVKLQKENEHLRAGVYDRRSTRDNNDAEEASDGNDSDDKDGKPRVVKLSTVEVEHMKRELRERQAQLAILNARYENLEANAFAEREIQEKTLEQMEQMNRQVHKLRTQLQDAQIGNEELEVKVSKNAELDKEVEMLRDQNHRLEARMTALCESPFINDAFQRKERIDRLFDLEKLTELQKETITRMADENHKLQQLVKELEGHVKQMKQSKDGVEAELQRVKQLLNEERNTRSSAPIQMQITPRQPVVTAPSKPLEPIVVNVPVRQPDRRDASSSPLHASQAPKADPSAVPYRTSVVVTRKYENLMTPISSLLDPECKDVKSIKQLRNRVHMLQITHLKSIQELERCEKMLQTQTDINRELSLEIEQLTTHKIAASHALQKRMRDVELLCEERLQRIQRLEAEIRQLKYLRGKADDEKARDAMDDEAESSDDDDSDAVSTPESLVLAASELAPGEQLVELWVRSASFDRRMVGDNASTFVLCDFFDFESQSTPLMIGNHPEYNLSSIFKVTVDGFFLRYLASEMLMLEVHQAVRGDFQVVGRASIRLAALLQSKGAIKEPDLPIYKVEIAPNGEKKASMGTLDAVLRLSTPIAEIWRLHLQSYPADIKLLSLDMKKTDEGTMEIDKCCNETATERDETARMNELRITVFACRGLVSSKNVAAPNQRPSPYVHYQLLGFPDIFTNIVPESASPEFDLECSRQAFVLEVDAYLLRFFSKFKLWFTVFDDEVELGRDTHDGGMIGKCGVFLSELVEGNHIKGWRPLLNSSNQPAGEISVLIEWLNPFQVLAVGSAQHGCGVNSRTADLHVLDLDQQHNILQAFSSCLNGRVNYRQFLQYAAPPEELELLTSKIKERLEATLDSLSDQKVSQTAKGLLVPNSEIARDYKRDVVTVQQLVATLEKLGVILSESEIASLRKYFAAPQQEAAFSHFGGNQKDEVEIGYLLMHANPRLSCRDRLLSHKLRHTLRGFLKQRAAAKSSAPFLSPEQVFERFDELRGGYVSRAEFRRSLSVLGFELQNTDEEYQSLVESKLEQMPSVSSNYEKAPSKMPGPVTSTSVTVTEPVDDDSVLLEAKELARSEKSKPSSTSVLAGVTSKSRPTLVKAMSITSAADEFQRRKQAFTDRMKAIASASSKSLVYEQIEKKQLEERRQFETTTAAHLQPPNMAALDERLNRFHHQQVAARKLQKQYRHYKRGVSSEMVDIIESDLVLSKVLAKWSKSELESWTDGIICLIEEQIPDARKSKVVSRKQLAFFLSKVPRMALPAPLLKQLSEYFSARKPGSIPGDFVAYRPLLNFIRLAAIDDAEKENLQQHPVWEVLCSIQMDNSHALEAFETVGDMQSTGVISFRKFRDALLRLGVHLLPKDLRVLMAMYDVSGADILYHAFLYTIHQLPFTQELVRTMTRCCRFGVSSLREKLIALANSSDDGTVSKSELHDALMQSRTDFVAFTPKDAHILVRLVNNRVDKQSAVAERVSIDELFKHLSRFENGKKLSTPFEDLNKYPVNVLQGLARNCRKFLCSSYVELQSAFERFDWKESGVVSLGEFVSIARQCGFAVFTETQLKTMAKLFGVKVDGRFGINYRQFLDWTTPSTLPDVQDIEAKLRCAAQDRAQKLSSKQLTDVLTSWREVFSRHAESSPNRIISRSKFSKICREELRLPLTDEEMRSLLFAYDRQLLDEVNYMAFVQLNWKETQSQPQQAQKQARRASVSFQMDQCDTGNELLVEELMTKLRGRKVTERELATALKSFSSNPDENAVGEGEFVLALRQLGVVLSHDRVRPTFQALARGLACQGKVGHSELIRALGLASVSAQTNEAPKHKAINEESRKRLETAVEAAARYSLPAFQAAFGRFQEFCVVHRFGHVPAPQLCQELNADGFVDLLSAKGAGMLAQTFTTGFPASLTTSGAAKCTEQVALKGVHAFLKGYLDVSEAEPTTYHQATGTDSTALSRVQRAQSGVVHPLDLSSREDDIRDARPATKSNPIELLVSWCEAQGIDFRGEFEQYDREYTGAVGAVEFKQVLLRLGLKQFSGPDTSAEAVVGQLVREFRAPPPHDAVCYTSMLNQVTTYRIFSEELKSCLSLSEDMRARTRQRAKFTGKIDQADPSICTKLDACFSHFDREKKGFLSESSVLVGLQALKYDPTKEQLRQLMTLMCVFRHNGSDGDNSAEVGGAVSRMEFDAFVLDPYAFRVLHRLAGRLYERVASPREPDMPRIALLARLLSENDAPAYSGAVTRDVFYSLLGNALGRPVLDTERHSLRHLFDVNRNARIAYKLFLKVMSQWRGSSPPKQARAQLMTTPGSTARKTPPCALSDLLASLHNQLSSIDFDAQIEILHEYLQEKGDRHGGLIKTQHLIRIFELVGLSLSADGFKSLEVYFAPAAADGKSEEGVISYEELVEELVSVHREVKATSRK